jgi:hypothetical protein
MYYCYHHGDDEVVLGSHDERQGIFSDVLTSLLMLTDFGTVNKTQHRKAGRWEGL